MFRKKNYVIVGLSVFHNEFLKISIPGLARLKIFLIIHNDNPGAAITKSDIRKLGYRGPLHIINNNECVGPLCAKINILNAIRKLRILSTWMIFLNDCDMLLNIDVPNVSKDNFAIMQNVIVLQRRLLDLLRIMKDPHDFQVDGVNITTAIPHVGISGTWVRTDMMVNLGRLIQEYGAVQTNLAGDTIIWMCLVAYARRINPAAAPIYMDRADYVAVRIDKTDLSDECDDAGLQNYCETFEVFLSTAV